VGIAVEKTMLADGATNPDPWVQDNDSHHLNIRQLYVEMGDPPRNMMSLSVKWISKLSRSKRLPAQIEARFNGPVNSATPTRIRGFRITTATI
jgi:hypothetical protein